MPGEVPGLFPAILLSKAPLDAFPPLGTSSAAAGIQETEERLCSQGRCGPAAKTGNGQCREQGKGAVLAKRKEGASRVFI